MKKFAPKNFKINCPGCPPKVSNLELKPFQFSQPKTEDTKKMTVVDTSKYKKKFGDTKQDSLF